MIDLDDKRVGQHTGIPLPVKVVIRIAMTFQLFPQGVASRAMCEGNVIVCNIVEEMDLILFEHQPCCNGVHRSVAPALIEESAIAVERLEEVEVSL